MLHNVPTLLVYYASSAVLLVAFLTLRLLQFFPRSQWLIFEMMNKIATIQMPRENYRHSLFTWPMFTSMRSSILRELQKSASRGKPAPDSQLVSVDGKSRCRLLEFSRRNRPLVVNFCSWTCPVFRTRVDEFLSIAREFSDVADFLAVYIEEAHPSDGWAFKVSAPDQTLDITVIDSEAPLPNSRYIAWRFRRVHHGVVMYDANQMSYQSITETRAYLCSA